MASSYGEGFLKATQAAATAKGITIVATENYGQADSSVTAQMLKITAANPDAVYIFSAGTPGALPQIELATRGYKGLVYQTQGVASADFLRVGGKSLDGAYMTVAPVLVAEQLPDSNASKKAAMTYVKMYEDKYGAGTRSLFGATAWSAMNLLNLAVPTAVCRAWRWQTTCAWSASTPACRCAWCAGPMPRMWSRSERAPRAAPSHWMTTPKLAALPLRCPRGGAARLGAARRRATPVRRSARCPGPHRCTLCTARGGHRSAATD